MTRLSKSAFSSALMRVLRVLQGALSLVLVLLIPAVCIVALYIGTNGAPFEKIETRSCAVRDGGLINPFAATGPGPSEAPSVGTPCAKQLASAYYYGEHEVLCYLSAKSHRLTASPFELGFFIVMGVLSLVLAAIAIPFILSVIRSGVSGHAVECVPSWQRTAAPLLTIAIPAFAILLTRSTALVERDIAAVRSRHWAPAQCTIVELCRKDTAGDAPGVVFERQAAETRYRGRSYNGFTERLSNSELEGVSAGSQVACFFNPKFPAQMKLSPVREVGWVDYIKEILLSFGIAVCLWGILRIGRRNKTPTEAPKMVEEEKR